MLCGYFAGQGQTFKLVARIKNRFLGGLCKFVDMRQDDRVKTLFDDFASDGDMRAYEELYLLLCSRLTRFSASIVGSFQLAEEIVSDVFLMFWQKRPQLKAVDQPRVYIYVCVRNFSLNRKETTW